MRHNQKIKGRQWGYLGSVALLIACGASSPPPELVDARAAYQQAQAGPASQYAPAVLDTARQALEEAENSFKDDGDSDRTKTLAYVAERKAKASSSVGEREKAKRQLTELEEKHVQMERKRLNQTEEQLKDAQARLQRTDEQLKQEREARKAAETRLNAAVASLAEMASVKEEARGTVITLSGAVLFVTGKYELLPLAQEKLKEVAAALKDRGFNRIIIEGHTDSVGSTSKNEELSLQRANSVKSYLVSQGLDGNKISTKGLGPSRPIASNDSADGRANNRRVELIVDPG